VLAIDGAPGAEARIREAVPTERQERVEVRELAFEGIRRLPAAGLVYAGFALPFQRPEVFDRTWAAIRAALLPGALLAVNLFGERDTWADDPAMTSHTLDQARALLDGLDVVALREQERDGSAVSGPKHWHVLDLIARA
jgi:hypothetical protein